MEELAKTPNALSAKSILEEPASNYMNTDQQEFFKNYLIELHDSTRKRIQEAKDQLSNRPDLSDISDRASWEEQFSLLMRIVDREQKLLPKIQQSLQRIRLGEYGYCLETGESIGIARLLARPTAEYCADVKQCHELKEHVFLKNREA